MQDKTRRDGVFIGYLRLSSRVMLPIPVLCSRRIKMKICYLRTSRISWSAASSFPLNEFPFTFGGLTASMNSAPGSIWTVWERRRRHHTLRTWQGTTRIGKDSRRRRRYACTDTSRHSRNPMGGNRLNPMDRLPGSLWRMKSSRRSVSDTGHIGRSKAMFSAEVG